MIRRAFALLLLGALSMFMVFPLSVRAQSDSAASDTVGAWTYDLAGKLSGSQAAYKDWQEGGLNTVSFTTSIDGTAQNTTNRWTQTHELRLGFGIIKSEDDEDDEPLRKSTDLIRAQTNLRYRGNGFFRRFKPTISARLRTQFAKGFDYTNNPFPDGTPQADREPPVQTSAFLAPAFITETIGLTYNPKEWYTVRLSAASKQTVVRDRSLGVLYDIDPGETSRIEAGTELAATFDREILPNVRYKSTANVFFSFNQTENPPDVLWENYITMQVNSWLTTDLEFVALFDENTTDAIQLKQVLSVGVTFVLI
jgi:hypothetical protein